MEQSLHKRVYINPNFKRSEMNPWPAEPIKTTHFNRHYLEVIPKKITSTVSSQTVSNNRKVCTESSQTVSNNRKIYVNPNFISGNNVTQNNQSTPAGAMYSVNVNMNNVPNKQLLHKSKYSLVQNCQPNVVNKEQAITDINKNNAQTVTSELYQNPKKLTQEVPLTRSRYCIIRKKKRLSANVEGKTVNITKDMVTANQCVQYPIACSNKLTCYTNLQAVKNSEKNKICKTPEKITKIKITKYKTIPISYLKKNTAVDNNKKKFSASPLKPYIKNTTKLSSSLITCNKNRFRFIKNSTPIKSTITAASKITQHKEKGVLCSGNKIKLLRTPRAKFNINNIPCRLFTKYGKCLRQDQGYCKYLHDKKHVSLCHKFLKGICHDKNCTLSHDLTDKKMPTCYFYLKGMCTKECCPYLHVKLSDKTKICQEFAKGYCESGDKCLFRHVSIKKLRQKRKMSSSSFQKNSQMKVIQSKPLIMEKHCIEIENCDTMKISVETTEKDDGDCRYYKELVNSDDAYENIKPTRCKLGTLPSFIQL